MSKMIAALIRHADYQQRPHTPSAFQPYPLNVQGRLQAREGGRLLREKITQEGWFLDPSIDSSRLLRAWQTAEILMQELQEISVSPLQIVSHDALAERSVGAAANLTLDQIAAVIHEDPRFPDLPADWKSNSHYCLPLQGAESLIEAGKRVANHLSSTVSVAEGTSEPASIKLFVGHGAAFRHAAYHLGILQFEQIARLSMYHCQPVFIERVTKDHWCQVGGEWKVRATNETFTD